METARAWTGAELRFAGGSLVAMDGNCFDATRARPKHSFLAVENPLTGARLKVRGCGDGSEGVEFIVGFSWNTGGYMQVNPRAAIFCYAGTI